MVNYMNIREVASFCLTTCKTATPEDRFLFINWIPAAMRSIGPNRDWVKVDVLYPKDFSFCKPSDLVSTISLALYDTSDREVTYHYNSGSKRIHTNRFLINSDAVVNATTSNIDLSEDANYYHMSTNATDIAYMLIRYYAMPVDQEGFPLIPESDLLAYEAFCRFMWSKRADDNRSKIQQEYDFWISERNRIKANRKMPTEQEAIGIFKRYLSLLSTPIFDTH